jgi:hypothetical protein
MIDADLIGRVAAGVYLVGLVLTATWVGLNAAWTLSTRPHEVPHHFRATTAGQLKMIGWLMLIVAAWPVAWGLFLWLAREGRRS